VKLLVTGASGLLGTRICQLSVGHNNEVYSAYSQHLPQSETPIKLDITDGTALKQLFEKTKPDVVVHSAALTDVDKCEKERDLAWKINVESTSNIAQLCHKHNCFLVYISTDYVFNGEKGNYRETEQTAPINNYGLTKLKGEEEIKKSKAEYCIARTSVIYGSNPAAGKINFALWLLEKLRKKEEAKTVIDQWNSPTFNTNLAEMVLEILERRITGTFHLAGATRLTRHEFAQKIAETFNLDQNLLRPTSSEKMPWIAKRPRDTSLSVEKAKQTLKNKPLQISEALSRLKIEMSQSLVKT
jgi:dTDP-4-dehydrorhamnose reductase